MRLPIAALATTALLLAAPARAQNWLENGEFEVDTDPWGASAGAGLFEWSPLDHGGGGGSVLFSSTDAGPLFSRAVTQCVHAHAGDTYDTRAFFFIPAAQSAGGYAQLFVGFYSDSACGSPPLAGTGASLVADTNAWIERQILNVVAPAGTTHARVTIQLTKNTMGGEFRVHGDGARLIPHPFFADGFASGNTDAWDVP